MTDRTIEPGPVVTVEAMDSPSAPQWFDLTCDLVSARIRRGRTQGGPQVWLNRVPAGELVLTLNNESGRYSRFDKDLNIAIINENAYIRVRAEWNLQHHHVGGFYVEQWREKWDGVNDIIEIVAVDAMGYLAEQGGAFEWTPGTAGQTVSKRVEQLLVRAGQRGVPYYSQEDGPCRCISPLLFNTPIIDEIHKTVLSENGVLFHEPISPIADVTAVQQDDSWVYLGANRFDQIDVAHGDDTPPKAESTTASDWRKVTGNATRNAIAKARRSQGKVPVFSDNCVLEDPDGNEYVDIEWSYVGYERPSVVAVANRPAPVERDNEGNEIDPPWDEIAVEVMSSQATRHRVIEITDLRFSTDTQGYFAAATLMEQLEHPKLEVSKLRLFPHFDKQQFDELLKLRLQDHVVTVRNLIHQGTDTAIGQNGRRVEIDSMIEGIEHTLTPSPWATKDGQVRWDTVLVLSPLVADVMDIEFPPPKPTTPTKWNIQLETEGANTKIDQAAGKVQLRFTTTRPLKPGKHDFAAMVTHPDLVTQQQVRFETMNVTGSAGNWTVTGSFDLDLLIPGRNFIFQIVEASGARSNTVSMATPHLDPPVIRIVRQSAWEGGFPWGATSTQIGLEWDHVQGARYDVGKANDHTGGFTPIRSNIAGTSMFEELPLDSDFSYAIRFTGTGTWGPRLKISTGHPYSIEIKENVLLAASAVTAVGDRHPTIQTATVPVISPPGASITGDAWKIDPAVTYDGRFLKDSQGNPGGYIGTFVKEMRLLIEKRGSGATWPAVGEYVDNDSFEQYVIQHLRGQTPDILAPGGSNYMVKRIPNPSWDTSKPFPAPTRKRIPLNCWVTDGVWPGAGHGAAYARNGTFGLQYAGKGFLAPSGARVVGGLELWGTTATGTSMVRNRVIP